MYVRHKLNKTSFFEKLYYFQKDSAVILYVQKSEVGARAFFAIQRSRARNKKERGSAKKKEHEKSKIPEHERKKREFALFTPYAAPHWKPSSRVQLQGEK